VPAKYCDYINASPIVLKGRNGLVKRYIATQVRDRDTGGVLSWCLFSEMGAEAGTCGGSKADVCFLLRCLGAKGRTIQPHMANGLARDF